MTIVSLVLNVLVLIPVTVSLAKSAPWTRSAFGGRTPARDILLNVYLAILATSLALIAALLFMRDASWLTGAIAALLVVQVIYKALTALTVRDRFRNPVVLANLGIAGVHTITLIVTVMGTASQ